MRALKRGTWRKASLFDFGLPISSSGRPEVISFEPVSEELALISLA
jgi:hypothetical protein